MRAANNVTSDEARGMASGLPAFMHSRSTDGSQGTYTDDADRARMRACDATGGEEDLDDTRRADEEELGGVSGHDGEGHEGGDGVHVQEPGSDGGRDHWCGEASDLVARTRGLF